MKAVALDRILHAIDRATDNGAIDADATPKEGRVRSFVWPLGRVVEHEASISPLVAVGLNAACRERVSEPLATTAAIEDLPPTTFVEWQHVLDRFLAHPEWSEAAERVVAVFFARMGATPAESAHRMIWALAIERAISPTK